MSITRLFHQPTANWIDLADEPFSDPLAQEIVDACYRKCSRQRPSLFCVHWHPVYLQRRPPSHRLCAVSMEDGHAHKATSASEMSVEHRREQSYSSLVLEAVGIKAPREHTLPSGARPDVAVFSTVPYGIEIQRAHVTPDTAVKRTLRAIDGGMSYSLWVNDGLKRDQARWYGRVPGVNLNVHNWTESMPRLREITVAGGLMIIEAKRCTPEFFPRCPKRSRRHCEQWHPWLTQWLDAKEEHGRFSYDDVLLGLAEGVIRPLRFNGKRVILTSQRSITLYEKLIGRPAELLFNPRAELRPSPDVRERDDEHTHSRPSRWPEIIKAEMCEQMRLPLEFQKSALIIRPHFCTLCGRPARQYRDGWRCDEHRPGAERRTA